MGFIDDIKVDRDLQIQTACVAFFLLIFPLYFFSVAAGTVSPAGMGGVGKYSVSGELTYIDFESGEEDIVDGTPFVIDLNTDALDNLQGENIVGVNLMLSYDENEQPGSGITCTPVNSGQNQADTISGTATHLNFSSTADGQNNGGNGDHSVVAEWYNSSMIDSVVEGLSEADINSQLNANDAGLGDYSFEISVSSNAGGGPGCQRSDSGEIVSYTIQLIVLDYTIVPFVEIENV
jgi:hypothetical protein